VIEVEVEWVGEQEWQGYVVVLVLKAVHLPKDFEETWA
jgi:hypothetical protein